MTTIIVGGDSYVHGNELEDFDRSQQSSLCTWPALLAQGQVYICAAYQGYSNASIARTVVEQCSLIKDPKIVLVSWADPFRYEFKFKYDIKQLHSPWASIDPWLIKDKETIESELVNRVDHVVKKQFVTNQKAEKTGLADFARIFYQHVGDSEYYELYASLREIVYLQNYLKLNNIPYLFTAGSNVIFKNFFIKKPDITINSLLEQLDMTRWFWFPDNLGFYQWAIKENYPMGAIHPLESAHVEAAKLIDPHYKVLLNEIAKHIRN